MPLWLRRTIFIAFIALFVAVAPVLALYSMGYRYHWGKQRIEATGLLLVDGTPADAVVRIDGVVRARRLPARIGGLGANEYDVRVEREGYHPWERRVTVTGGRTAFATALILFRDAEPERVLAGNIGAFAMSADREWAALVRRAEGMEEVWIVDLERGTRALALRIPEIGEPHFAQAPRGRQGSPLRSSSAGQAGVPTSLKLSEAGRGQEFEPVALAWSPRGARLLVTVAHPDGLDAFAVDPREPADAVAVHRTLDGRPAAIAWELASANALIARLPGRLSRVALTTRRAVPLAVPPPDGPFAVHRDTLFATVGGAIVARPVNGGPTRTITMLPAGSMLHAFEDLRGDTLTALVTTPLRTIAIALDRGTTRVQDGRALDRLRRPDRTLWRTETSELWTSAEDTPPTLLIRSAVPIATAAWHPEGSHVFSATAREVIAMEASDGHATQPTILATFDAIVALTVVGHGDTLLIVGQRGEDRGLWTLPLR